MSTPPTLDVFSLRDRVVHAYRRFATSFTTIHAPDIKAQVEASNPSYRRTTDVEALGAAGVLDPRFSQIFRAKGEPLALHTHQEQAVALAEAGESYVVTSGTGSGKSLGFFILIVSCTWPMASL